MNVSGIIVSVILILFKFSAMASVDSTNIYIHDKAESIQSKVIKFGMTIAGIKKHIEKSLLNNKFDQHAANIPRSLKKNTNISIRQISGRDVFHLSPKAAKSDKVIIYLHGGAYIANLSKIHWEFIGVLLSETNASFIVPDYPLAPDANYFDVFSFMDEVYRQAISETSPENIIIMGDSAGGGLALSFVQNLRNKNAKLPNKIIMISPWLDITLTEPEIPIVDKKDKMLSLKGLQMAGKLYADSLNPENYLVSPIYGDFSGLPEISVFIGTHDIMWPDCKRLVSIVEETNTKLKYFEYPKMFHVWVLIGSLKESKSAVNQIINLITDN